MWKLYAALIIAGVVAAAGFWFKSTLEDNADLKAQKSQLESDIRTKNGVIEFERGRAKSAEEHAAALDKQVRAIRADRDHWKGDYEQALNSDKASHDWGEALVPPPVARLMGVRDNQRAARLGVLGNQVAATPVAGLPVPGPAKAGGNADKATPGRGG